MVRWYEAQADVTCPVGVPVRDFPAVRISGRAVRFLELLQEYGHLDNEGLNRVLLGAGEVDGAPLAGRVDVAEARRAAAMVLFHAADPDNGALAEDWPLLFS